MVLRTNLMVMILGTNFDGSGEQFDGSGDQFDGFGDQWGPI